MKYAIDCNLLYETWISNKLEHTVVLLFLNSIFYRVLQNELILRIVLMCILYHICLSMWTLKQHWNMSLLLKIWCILCCTCAICYICMYVGDGDKTESLMKIKVFRKVAFHQRNVLCSLLPSDSHECHLIYVNIYSSDVLYIWK